MSDLAGRAADEACTIELYRLGDAEQLHAAALESVADMAPWMPWCHPAYRLEEARAWVAEQVRLAESGTAYQFVIWSGGRYVGACGINQINVFNKFGNLGYWVRSSEMGRGFAVAAARQVAAFAFEKTQLVRLEIVCAVGNVRSQRVAEKVGAHREGVLRNRLLLPGGPVDAVMYSLVSGGDR